MKKMKTLLIASVVLAAGFSGVASAHDYLGGLGTATTAKDIWYFSCLNSNTNRLQVQIRRQAGTPCVRVTASSPAYNVTSCSTSFSSLQTLSTGAGAKVFTVQKSPQVSGAASYTVRAHCIDNTGVHNPADQNTPQTYIQNQ